MILTQTQLKDVAAGTPLRFAEPSIKTEFVVIRADDFDRTKWLIDASDLTLVEQRDMMLTIPTEP